MITKNISGRALETPYGFMAPIVRTEVDSDLDLDSMTAYEILAYAQNHPGTHEDLVRSIHGRYNSEKVTALLQAAETIGASKDPLVTLLESDLY